jgi:hypothetical protein
LADSDSHAAMAAVLSPQPSNPSSPRSTTTSLPPLITSPPPSASRISRAPSYANKRLSTFSNTSNVSARSRPTSIAYPLFHSSLPYTLVRDFAYGPLHPLFYGPLPEQPSEISTPASEFNRRLSDPPALWDSGGHGRAGWTVPATLSLWTEGEQLPQTSFDNGRFDGRGDGPPYSEDEDIHSPVVTSTRHHKKHKSNIVDFDRLSTGRGFALSGEGQRRGSYTGTNGDGSRTYYVSEELEAANGPGGEYITYPPSRQRNQQQPTSAPSSAPQAAGNLAVRTNSPRRDSHFAGSTLPRRRYDTDVDPMSLDINLHSSPSNESPYTSQPSHTYESPYDSEDEDTDASRLSRSYTLSIVDPAEEMAGKAVALFDFARENDNELPLVEGQVILISYRHGQGWLVAQDPKTGESGLVPEEYVRLLRDIEGGLRGWMGGENNGGDVVVDGVETGGESGALTSPYSYGDARTPTQAEHGFGSSGDDGKDGKERHYTPVVSTFSTSSKDFENPKGSRGKSPKATATSTGGEAMDVDR